MRARRREWKLFRSPGLSLLPQMEEEAAARSGRGRRRAHAGREDAKSPGFFYTLFSAGSLKVPEEDNRGARAPANPRFALLLAGAMAVIWVLFRR